MLSGQVPGTYGMGEESVGRGCGDGGPGGRSIHGAPGGDVYKRQPPVCAYEGKPAAVLSAPDVQEPYPLWV